MYTQQLHRPVTRYRSMNSPYQRGVVNGEGLGDLEGFNPGKAFKRLITIKKSSFKLKNIAGAIGSAVSFAGTGGMSSVLAPKTFGAHSKVMRVVGGVAVVAGIAAATVFSGGAILAALPALLPSMTLGGALTAAASGLTIATTGMSLMKKKKPDGSNYSQQEVVAAQAAYDQSQQGLLAAQQGQQQEKAQLEYRQQLNEEYEQSNIQEEPYYPTPVSEQLDQETYDTMPEPDEGMSGMDGVEFMGRQWTFIELGLVGIAGWYFLSQSKSVSH